MRISSIIVFLISLAASADCAENQPLFPLTGHVTVKRVDVFGDGGSTRVVLLDESDREFKFCLKVDWSPVDDIDPKPRQLILSAADPDDPNGKKVDLGGAEEWALVNVLNSWITRTYNADEIEMLRKGLLVKSDDEDRLAGSILNIMRELKNRSTIK